MTKFLTLSRCVVTVTALVLVDQATKWVARRVLLYRSFAAGPVGLVLTMNRGVAFGLFGGQQWVIPLNAVLGIVVCAAGVVALKRGENGLAGGLLLVFAGFAGNFIDRVGAGQVTDFLWVRGWSVFNFADCLVTAGAVLCGLALLFPDRWGLHG